MIFLNLGHQPLANNYTNKKELSKKKKYILTVQYQKKNNLISIKKKFKSKIMFNNKYPYRSSLSKTMRKNFKDLAKNLINKFHPKKILEIGCNDGVFLKNFNSQVTVGVEPCKNIADLIKLKKINVHKNYWDLKLANKIKNKHGKFDLIYSANTITHIKDLDIVFRSINQVLSEEGILVIEDPSLLECIKNVSYDQFYNEHIYVFSLISLQKILKKHKLEIFKVENLNVHGGSNRYYIKKSMNKKIRINHSVKQNKIKELKYKLDKFITYRKFGKNVKESKRKLKKLILDIKNKKKSIIGYGATAKSVTVMNYCGFKSDEINYFVDTTPEKKNKYLPGTNIIVKKYKINSLKNIDYVYLGAWNFKNEILNKERKYIKKGLKFITHVPYPRII